jgi:hypothetical protein
VDHLEWGVIIINLRTASLCKREKGYPRILMERFNLLGIGISLTNVWRKAGLVSDGAREVFGHS